MPLVVAIEGSPDLLIEWRLGYRCWRWGCWDGVRVYRLPWLIETTGSVRASLVTYIIPVVGLFLGWLVLDEGIGVNTLAGAALIVVGVASVMRGQAPVERRHRRWRRRWRWTDKRKRREPYIYAMHCGFACELTALF